MLAFILLSADDKWLADRAMNPWGILLFILYEYYFPQVIIIDGLYFIKSDKSMLSEKTINEINTYYSIRLEA